MGNDVKTLTASGPETRGALEATKHRALVLPYCRGNGIDLGPSHDPITGFCVRIDRDPDRAHFCGDVSKLKWFADDCLDFVHASHVLEDFSLPHWPQVLAEWGRVIQIDGFLIVAVPDHQRFRAAVARGQGDNLDHRHESFLGELPPLLPGWRVMLNRFVTDDPDEYSIVYVAQKPAPSPHRMRP